MFIRKSTNQIIFFFRIITHWVYVCAGNIARVHAHSFFGVFVFCFLAQFAPKTESTPTTKQSLIFFATVYFFAHNLNLWCFFSCPVFLDDIINILSGTFTLNTYKSRAYLCMCVSNTKNINCLYVCTNQTFFRLVLQRPTEKYMYSNQTKIQFIFSFVSIPKKATIYSCLRHETCKKRKKLLLWSK